MTLYLQRNYNSNMLSISAKNNHKDEVFDYDYEELEEIENTMTFSELYDYLIKKYNCKKLVIQF